LPLHNCRKVAAVARPQNARAFEMTASVAYVGAWIGALSALDEP
jgi:hypothetical protein